MSAKYLSYIIFVLAIAASLYIVAAANTNPMAEQIKSDSKNVLGNDLESCCFDPMTGYYRDGYCSTDHTDYGSHTVCAVMTQEFLDYTKSKGNDLSSAKPAYNFPGLKAGDKWCLCSVRWLEAYYADKAPNLYLAATHKNALDIIPMEYLIEKAIKQN